MTGIGRAWRGVVAVTIAMANAWAFLIWPVAAGAAAGPVARGGGPQVAFTVRDSRISEASGLAASRRHPGIVYTHNDSGGRPKIFAIGPDGRTRATLTLAGATARDWEAIGLGRDDAGRPALFVGDIGDNLGGAWPYVTVYRIPEPDRLVSRTVRATAFRLKYADGPRNAESMLIDPRTNRLYIASKLLSGALYAAPAKLSPRRMNVLRRVGAAPMIATDGAFAPDGRSFVIRSYFAAYFYSAPGRLLDTIDLPSQEQGESVTYTPDGTSLLVGSEGADQPVWRVPLPSAAAPSPAVSRGTTGPQVAPPHRVKTDEGLDTHLIQLFIVAGVAGLVAAAIIRRRT